jgi:ATP-dependent Clp protease ATP-binding subunit ClpC
MIRHSDSLILVWNLAEIEARHKQSSQISPAYFLLGLLKVVDLDVARVVEGWYKERGDSLEEILTDVNAVRSVFSASGAQTKPVRRRLRGFLVDGTIESPKKLRRDSESRQIFKNAESMDPNTTRPIHLLVAILSADLDIVSKVLIDSGVDPRQLLNDARALLSKGSAISTQLADQNNIKGTLDVFGRDLTALAKTGKLEPVIGRKDEIKALGQILLQTRKRNVILTGDAGVGKTAIVEGLAQRIVSERAVAEIRSLRIVEISVAALVAGTTFRGDFESRIQALLKAAATDTNVVLFIDEIHLLIGAGRGSQEGLDAANILKPALSRGEIRVIGATTTSEYRRYIEKDPSLERRFQALEIAELSRDNTIELLQSVRPRLERHYSLIISDDALRRTVDLSISYMRDRRLPDKALDLIDQVCAQMRMQSLSSLNRVDKLTVGGEDVARTVSRISGVPLTQISTSEKEQLLHMEERLRERVKGQDHALALVADSIRLAKSGLRNESKPIAVFLLAGPTGTGKTELAKAVAEFLFGGETHMIRLDMSEFMESHSVSKLIGSPPGYVGYEEGGRLTEKIRSTPSTVILLDEIEKAHPKIMDVFLQVFDEGVLTDSRGRKCDFRNTVIFLTSNLGFSDSQQRKIGFGQDSVEIDAHANSVLESVRKSFKPEFINRLSNIIVFHPLSREALHEIVDKFLGQLNRRLAKQDISVRLTESAYDYLLSLGFNELYGAREIARTIEAVLAKPISTEILQGKILSGARLTASASHGNFALERA